jgi:hypothetical protein
MELIYPELRRIAQSFFRNERRERVLQPTALVNEAYLRLVAQQQQNWRNGDSSAPKPRRGLRIRLCAFRPAWHARAPPESDA